MVLKSEPKDLGCDPGGAARYWAGTSLVGGNWGWISHSLVTLLLVFQEANTSGRRGRGAQRAQRDFEGAEDSPCKALQTAPLPRAASVGIAQAPEAGARCSFGSMLLSKNNYRRKIINKHPPPQNQSSTACCEFQLLAEISLRRSCEQEEPSAAKLEA